MTIFFNNLQTNALYNKYKKLRIYKHILKKEYRINPNGFVLYQIMTLQKQINSLDNKLRKSIREYQKIQKQQQQHFIFY